MLHDTTVAYMDVGEGRELGAVASPTMFWEPGDYIVRLRVDDFSTPDSQFDNVCCWSNAYVPVTVTP